MIDHLSSSQLSLYQQCSLKYRFRYIDKIPVSFKSSNLVFGSTIHSALNWYHEELMRGELVALEDIQRVFSTDWYSMRVEENIKYKNGDEEKELKAKGKELLALYFDQPDEVKVEGAEVQFRIPIINPDTNESLDVAFEGFIDLIEKDHVITEFKTSAQSMNQVDADDLMQLTIYSYVYEVLYGKTPKRLKIVNFVKTKTPKLAVFLTKRTEEDYVRFFHLAKQVLSGIMLEIFYPNKSWMCKGCEYKALCKMWKG